MLAYIQILESEYDKEKFEKIYELYRGLMFYVADKILHNKEDAEDAVHQAFVSIIENIKNISPADSPKTRSFCVIVCERKAIDIYRKKNRNAAVEMKEEITGTEIQMPDGTLASAIAALPSDYREIILLRYDNGYSTKEAAKIMGISDASAHKLLWRAKKELEIKLKEERLL